MKERPRLCVGVFVFKEGKLLLLKSHKWENKYIFPSGHVELMESLEDTVKREVYEETNLIVKNIQFLTFIEFINSPEYHKKNLHFVGMQHTCEVESGEVKLNDEAEEYLWVNIEDSLKLNLEDGTRKAIIFYLRKESL